MQYTLVIKETKMPHRRAITKRTVLSWKRGMIKVGKGDARTTTQKLQRSPSRSTTPAHIHRKNDEYPQSDEECTPG